MRRSNLENEIIFYSVTDENSFDGGTVTMIEGSFSGLVSFGATPYSATEAKLAAAAAEPEGGNRFGAVRVFLKNVPAELKYGDQLEIPGMAATPFTITGLDVRGKLPGKYPNRIEATGGM